MSNRKNVEIKLPVVETLEQANVILAEIAERQRNLDLINAGLNEKIDGLKKQAEAECSTLVQEVEEREQALARFAEANKETLFKKPKSRELSFGELGFRSSTSTVLLNRQWDWELVLAELKKKRLGQFIRTKHEVDKEGVRALSEKRLASVGLKLKQKDTFFYEVKEETVGAEA